MRDTKPSSLSVTEACRNLSAYVDRVADHGERFILHRDQKPVAELRPIPGRLTLGELESVLRSLPRLGPDEAESLGTDIEAARAELRAIELDGT